MHIDVAEAPITALAEYARVPIAFEVCHVFDVVAPANGLGGLVLVERAVGSPYLKDYDQSEGGAPLDWPARFDMASWCLLIARAAGQVVGGAAVAFDTPDLQLLDERRDSALLWDIRVTPDRRQQGIGATLFAAVEAWSISKGCRRLLVETQNTNVPACRFYARQGCSLGTIRRFAYPEFPHEAQLMWYKDFPAA